MRYCIDIDNTICETIGGDYASSHPIAEMVEYVNQLYSEGHTIIFYTARGTMTGIDWRVLTEQQLKDWGVQYHQLVFGKPFADFYIDDRAEKPKKVCLN